MRQLTGWNDLDFVSERVNAVHRGPHILTQGLLMAVAAFFVVALIWAWLAVLDEVTSGEGRVIPSSQIQVVQNLEGGILKAVLVAEGDIVDRNQIILHIENTTSAGSYGELRAKYMSALAAVSRLTAETTQTALQFPTELMSERSDLAQSERSLYMARQSELQSQVSVFQQQVTQRTQDLADLKSKADHFERSARLLREEVSINMPLVTQGVVSKIDLLQLQRQLVDLESQIQSAKLNIPRAEAALREANQRIEEKVHTFLAESQKDLTQRRSELATLTEAITTARDRVDRTEVRSPVKGIIKQVKLRTIGGVVKPGMDLVEIVPLEDTLLVEAKVRPKDIAFIRPDQEAIVKITAYDYSIYGGLKAKVERISADTITDDDPSGRKNESYYRITVRTNKNHLGSEEHPLPIIPGMVSSVDILTGQKSVLDYLMKPILKARDRALRER